MLNDGEDGCSYRVVVNDEQQYSLWLLDREVPRGWRDAGKQGGRRECIAFIEEIWVDMRPRSLREAMEASPARVDE